MVSRVREGALFRFKFACAASAKVRSPAWAAAPQILTYEEKKSSNQGKRQANLSGKERTETNPQDLRAAGQARNSNPTEVGKTAWMPELVRSLQPKGTFTDLAFFCDLQPETEANPKGAGFLLLLRAALTERPDCGRRHKGRKDTRQQLCLRGWIKLSFKEPRRNTESDQGREPHRAQHRLSHVAVKSPMLA